MKLNTYNFFGILVILLLGFSCGKKQPTENTEAHHEEENTVELTNDQFATAGIKTGTLELKQITGTIKVNGLLDVPPQQKVSISIPFGGFLKNTELLQGMKVNKGQLIATVENPDFIQVQQDYLDLESQVEFAKAEYERQQTLSGENVNAQKTLQQSKASYYSLLAKLNGAIAKLKLLNISPNTVKTGNFTSVISIYAPIGGYVTRVNANIGMFLNPTDVLFEIVDTKHLHAELTVFEKDMNQLEIGQKVKFILANELEERTATVYLIGREIREERTVSVHCHLDEEDVDLIPGTYLKAYIENGEKKVQALPDEAIVKFQGKKYVFIEEEEHADQPGEPSEEAHHFKMIEIQTGNSDHGFTEVILTENSELPEARIVIKGAYDLLSKMKNSSEGHAH